MAAGNISKRSPNVLARMSVHFLFFRLQSFREITFSLSSYCLLTFLGDRSLKLAFNGSFFLSISKVSPFFPFQGASNVVGSFFSCLPSGASMSRSSVQVAVGGRTQLTSVVSIAILIVVILTAEELFYALPKVNDHLVP